MTFDHITHGWLKSKLKEHHLKQKDLAKSLATDKFTVSKWVNGKIPIGAMAKAAIHYFFKTL